MDGVTLHLGDAMAVLPTLPAGSFDAVVTDPPAGISFMGKEWDSFGGRSNGNAAADREDGKRRGPVNARNPHGKNTQPFGYSGSALPGKGERQAFVAFLSSVMAECLRVCRPGAVALVWAIPRTSHWTATACEDAGWLIEDRIAHLFGTGFPKHASKLKPACEDWWVCRKPGPKWLGVEECRVPTDDRYNCAPASSGYSGIDGYEHGMGRQSRDTAGRWPANLTHDGSDEVLGAFAEAGERPVGNSRLKTGGRDGNGAGMFGSNGTLPTTAYGDTGTAARFFFCSKASKADRGEGNAHPCTKSTTLMRWLVRLACPKGGVLLDPFAGSGSTLVAAALEGRDAVGVEREPEYHAVALRRLAGIHGPLFAEGANHAAPD